MGRKPSPIGPASRHIAATLAARKDELGWSYDQLAERSGVNRATAHRMLTGVTAFDTETLLALCAALNVNPGRLLDEASRQ